jgi:hypothetical protein
LLNSFSSSASWAVVRNVWKKSERLDDEFIDLNEHVDSWKICELIEV